MTRDQVELLKEAGVAAVQLGIESLSTPILKRMRKGVSASQNIQTLKWLTAAGLEVKWNFLHGLPGEEPWAYADLAGLIPKLVHLAAPQAVGRVRIDRFSPYFESPDRFGLHPPQPIEAYRHVFPFEDEELARLAYYFTAEGLPTTGRQAGPLTIRRLQRTLAALENWRELAGTVTLQGHDQPDGLLVLFDTRPIAASFEHRLRGWARALYLHCDIAPPRADSRVVPGLGRSRGRTRDRRKARPVADKWDHGSYR